MERAFFNENSPGNDAGNADSADNAGNAVIAGNAGSGLKAEPGGASLVPASAQPSWISWC